MGSGLFVLEMVVVIGSGNYERAFSQFMAVIE